MPVCSLRLPLEITTPLLNTAHRESLYSFYIKNVHWCSRPIALGKSLYFLYQDPPPEIEVVIVCNFIEAQSLSNGTRIYREIFTASSGDEFKIRLRAETKAKN